MSEDVHWFLPINPAAHAEHMPADWRTREDATEVWEAIGRSQPIDRWCLRTGFRTMKAGDVIWAYLSKRQELCAVGTVRRTAELCRHPIPRSVFVQVPMSVGRVGERSAALIGERAGFARP